MDQDLLKMITQSIKNVLSFVVAANNASLEGNGWIIPLGYDEYAEKVMECIVKAISFSFQWVQEHYHFWVQSWSWKYRETLYGCVILVNLVQHHYTEVHSY